MQTLENVFYRMTEFERLEEAYRKASRKKRYRDEILSFSNHLDSGLLKIQKEVRDGTFHIGPYRKHWVYVPKKRLVMALPFDSRIVQWAIYLELNPFYNRQMIEDSYACREEKGALAAARRLQYWLRMAESKPGSWYYLKLDISKYFYRIDHEKLLEILGEKIKDDSLMKLLRNIVEANGERFGLPPFMGPDEVEMQDWLSDVGMPIGNLTSQLFANIYLDKLDQFCKHQLHIKKYVRYMDDIVIIAPSKEAANRYREAIGEFLKTKLRLDLNRKTTVRPIGKIEFCGYIVTGQKLKLRKQTVRHIKYSFRSICRRYFAGEMTREELDRKAASYEGMVQHCDDQQIRKRLNEIYINEKEKAGFHG